MLSIYFLSKHLQSRIKDDRELIFLWRCNVNALEYQNRAKAGDLFYDAFLSFLNEPNAFELSPGDIKTVSVLESVDGDFKLVSWQVRYLENKSKYYGFIVFPDGSYVQLKDNYDFT